MPLIPSPWHTGTTAGAVLAMVLTAAACYFLGCLNGSLLVSRDVFHDDVRTHGSGNAGLTNFYRTFGGPMTAVVVLCDMLKGALSVWLGVQLMHFVCWPGLEGMVRYWAALFCLLGHMFPAMFDLKGGKGILSGGAIVLMIDWRLALLVWGVFLLLAVSTRYVSLGSVCAAAMFPVGTWLFVCHDPIEMTIAVLVAALIIWKHRGNIQRLCRGTESKFTFRKKG